MALFKLLLLGTALATVFAKLEDEHHLNIKSDDQGVVTSESVDVNYKNKYVKISSPKQRGTQPGSLLHDYDMGLNVLKQNGECFILDKFDVIPEDIKQWEKVEKSITDDIMPGNSRHARFRYTALPYLVNRTTSSDVVRDFCPGPIKVVVLKDAEETDADVKTDGSRDDDDDESSESRGEVSENEEDLPTDIFIPDALADQRRDREKRALRPRRWVRINVNINVRVRIRIRRRRRRGWGKR